MVILKFFVIVFSSPKDALSNGFIQSYFVVMTNSKMGKSVQTSPKNVYFLSKETYVTKIDTYDAKA